eukprot:NODE_4844_length_753_cov_46.213068_g4491_i0.p1 GENE.NODE_4844_length_753_cov_46.213068_g4491_i0~~NODE_4844_length_753_cov_46.213068_g4491_i0.p1  ORF type:complete len:115 (+),score=8.93 NODE_4844_length_753_cov_46.213068_g4491_i0:354-698(+)
MADRFWKDGVVSWQQQQLCDRCRRMRDVCVCGCGCGCGRVERRKRSEEFKFLLLLCFPEGGKLGKGFAIHLKDLLKLFVAQKVLTACDIDVCGADFRRSLELGVCVHFRASVPR